MVNNLQKYADSEDISYEYVLTEAKSIVKELQKESYVSKAYLFEKMNNIKRFMDKFQE